MALPSETSDTREQFTCVTGACSNSASVISGIKTLPVCLTYHSSIHPDY